MDKAGQAGAAAGAPPAAGAADAPPAWFSAAFETLKASLETSVDKKINAIDKRLKTLTKGADPDPAAGGAPAADGADPAAGAAAGAGDAAANGHKNPETNAEVLKLKQTVDALQRKQEASDAKILKAEKEKSDMELRSALTDAMGGEIPWVSGEAKDYAFNKWLPTVKKDEAGRFIVENETGLPLLVRDFVEQQVVKDSFFLKAEGRRGSGATNGNGSKPWQQGGMTPADITRENMADPAKNAQARQEIAAVLAAGQK